MKHEPILIRDAVYDRKTVVEALGISSNTLWRWRKEGLPILQRGTKQMFFYGGDIIEYLRSRPDPPA
jgi:predicted site-specific integrase-resolvase